MKTFLLAIIASILLFSCDWKPEQKDFETFFKGNHELRKLSQSEKETYAISGSYFLFWGSVQGGNSSVKYIGFSWKSINDEYILSQIPVEKVRIKFDENAKIPYITFGYSPDAWVGQTSTVDSHVGNVIETDINYIIIHCKQSDYTSDVKTNEINP